MFLTAKTLRSIVVFAFSVCLTFGMLAFNASGALNHDDVKKAQQSLAGKGFYHGQVDGILGPQTRQAIGEYQKSEKRPVTGRLDVETAGKLGGGPGSVGGN